MTATPALSNDLAGKYQKKISDDLYLDRKESEGVLIELRAFAAELLAEAQILDRDYINRYTVITNSDPGDENA